MSFRIDPEFRAYLPPQTAEETANLTERIRAEGPAPGSLVVAVLPKGDRVLIDGHHTMQICEALGVEFPDERQIVFKTREEALAWMRKNQLSRRNLTPEQRTYLIGKEYEARKSSEGRKLGQNDPVGATAEVIAREQKVSAPTVKRAAEFAESVDKVGAADPEAKAAILKGEAPVTKGEVIAAAKSGKIRCPRCTRMNAWRDDCPQCQELREKPKGGRNGHPQKRSPRKAQANPQVGDADRARVDASTPPDGGGGRCGACGEPCPKCHPVPQATVEGFAEFWRAYPRKTGKKAAEKAWRKLKPSAALQAAILHDIEGRRNSKPWTKNGGEFIPHASTYLNGERWTDEGQAAAKSGNQKFIDGDE